MIPPMSPDVLSSNPQFAILHKTLTTKFLDHDASTRLINARNQYVEEQVNKHLAQTVRQRVLSLSLQNLVFSDDANALPAELRELIYIVSTYLLTPPPLTPTQAKLLTVKVQHLKDQLPKITYILSQELETQQAHLYDLATASSTTTTTDKLSRYSLQLHLKDMTLHLSTLNQLTIPTATATILNALATLLSLQTHHLTDQLTHLTRYTHGTLSRHTLSKSTHLATISKALSSKIQILTLEARRSTYSAQTQTALANYATHLAELELRLDQRIRTLEDEARLYADCDARNGKTIEELGRRYGNVLREIGEVKGDVQRLERKGQDGKERKVSRKDYEVP